MLVWTATKLNKVELIVKGRGDSNEQSQNCKHALYQLLSHQTCRLRRPQHICFDGETCLNSLFVPRTTSDCGLRVELCLIRYLQIIHLTLLTCNHNSAPIYISFNLYFIAVLTLWNNLLSFPFQPAVFS
jgi:hypothetical protein